jgi:segregation and condensation protein A
MQERLYNILLQKDEITWQSLIYELVRTGQMDPWNIDVSLLAQRYIKTLKELQETNFFISGKVILAAAILLKIKSDKLLTEKLASFDEQLFGKEEIEELQDLDFNEQLDRIKLFENPKLTIKTPLARKRKVSLHDLMGALKKALEIDKRRTIRKIREKEAVAHLKIPEKKIDLSKLIKEIYEKIKNFFVFKKGEVLTFKALVNSEKKEDKIMTFVPLLHLDNQEKINLIQEKPFGEINILLK